MTTPGPHKFGDGERHEAGLLVHHAYLGLPGLVARRRRFNHWKEGLTREWVHVLRESFTPPDIFCHRSVLD